MARLALVREQIVEIEKSRIERLSVPPTLARTRWCGCSPR